MSTVVLFRGFGLANDGTSPNTKINVTQGYYQLESGGLTSVGADDADISVSGLRGLWVGSVAANTVYHVFLATGNASFGFDTDPAGSHCISGTPIRLGSVITDGSSHIRAFHQHGDEFILDTSIKDVDATNPGTSAVTRTLTVPTGVQVQAIVSGVIWDSGQYDALYLSSLESADLAPAYANAIESCSSSVAAEGVSTSRIWTNTSAQIRSRVLVSTANTVEKVRTLGWVDNTRGQ